MTFIRPAMQSLSKGSLKQVLLEVRFWKYQKPLARKAWNRVLN